MAFVHGKSAAVLVGALDLTTYFRSMAFSADVDTADATTFGNNWKSSVVGDAAAKVDLDGLYDPALTAIADNLTNSAGQVVTLGPAGLALGARARLVKVLTTSYAETSPVGDVVAFKWGIEADGTAGMGIVHHALGAESTDGNGTAQDGGAQTTTGAIAHLHVTSVSASDSVIVTIEDSANGTSGWATIGTFASKSAAGVERITIAGTVRRYTRAVWDVTGTAVSIPFLVALART